MFLINPASCLTCFGGSMKMDTAQTRCDLHGRAASGGSAWQDLLRLAWKSCVGGFGLVVLLPMGNYNTYDITKMHAAQTRYGSIPVAVQLVQKRCLGWVGSAGLVAMGNYNVYLENGYRTDPVQLAWKSCLMWFGLAGLLPRGNYDTYDITVMHATQTWYGSIPMEVRLVWKSSLRWFGLAGGVATDPVWKHTRGSAACAEELPQGVRLSRVVEPTPKCISPGKWILHRPAVACVKELPRVVQLGRFIAYG
ncbi:hypothetical protein BKA83DRAFT_4127336 [Pisolithus microcarpus]|nr:hypothetical protein BKA83DRAFT_4127336 [Pisolithus microcarpus]